MLGAIAQFETEIRAERQMDGIKKAKERGVSFGRKKIDTESDPSTPAKARTGRVDQNTHGGLLPFKGYRISLSWENRMILKCPFSGRCAQNPKTPKPQNPKTRHEPYIYKHT